MYIFIFLLYYNKVTPPATHIYTGLFQNYTNIPDCLYTLPGFSSKPSIICHSFHHTTALTAGCFGKLFFLLRVKILVFIYILRKSRQRRVRTEALTTKLSCVKFPSRFTTVFLYFYKPAPIK